MTTPATPPVQVDLGPEWRELARRAEAGPFAAKAGVLVDAAAQRMAEAVRRRVEAGARRHSRGRYRLPKVIVRGSGSRIAVRVATGAGTNLLVSGVRSHLIRNDRPMPIRDGTGSLVAFAQAVGHPGYGGDPFVRRGIDAAAGELHQAEGALLDDLRRLLTGASGR